MGASKRTAMEVDQNDMPTKPTTNLKLKVLTAKIKPQDLEWRRADGQRVLVYVDARCVRRRLNEAFGIMNWQVHYKDLTNGGVSCIISVWDDTKKHWIEKEDVGTESNFEPIKGGRSDAFKRAAGVIGIGQELYDYPAVYLPDNYQTKYLTFEIKKQLISLSESLYSGKEKRGSITLTMGSEMQQDLSASLDYEEGKKQIETEVSKMTNKDALAQLWNNMDDVYKDDSLLRQKFTDKRKDIEK